MLKVNKHIVYADYTVLLLLISVYSLPLDMVITRVIGSLIFVCWGVFTVRFGRSVFLAIPSAAFWIYLLWFVI
jgi:hypothetical protein